MIPVTAAGPVAGPVARPVRVVSEWPRKAITVVRPPHQLPAVVVVVALAQSVRLLQVPAAVTEGQERPRALRAQHQLARMLRAITRSAGAAAVAAVLLVALAGPVAVATALSVQPTAPTAQPTQAAAAAAAMHQQPEDELAGRES